MGVLNSGQIYIPTIYVPPLWMKVLNNGQIYTPTIDVHIGVVNSGRHDSPHIRKSSLDHDSGGKIGGVRHMYSPPFTRLTGVRLERGTGTSSTQIVFSHEYCKLG